MDFVAFLRRFRNDSRGVVAVIFAVALLPLITGMGAAIDYTRASSLRADLQAGADAAALTVGRVAIETGRTDNGTQARQVFDAVFKRNDGTAITRFSVTQDLQKIVVDADARVPLQFANLLGKDSITVNATATVPLDDVTVEVALVLDNTGSMGSAGKMTALKTASKNLVTKLQNASVVNTNAFVALVPFNTQVRVTDADVYSAPPTAIRMNHPSDSGNPKFAVNPWKGCIADRDKPNDVKGFNAQGAPIEHGKVSTYFPAVKCDTTNLRPVMVLNRQFDQLRNQIDAMVSDGNTNTSIGLSAGLALLTPNLTPLLDTKAKQPSRFVKKHIVFLTDGENTQNRWTNSTAEIDAQTQAICAEIKRSNLNITLHTILLMAGNATLLRNCASSPDRYYFVTDPGQLNAVFDAIAAELLSLRLAR